MAEGIRLNKALADAGLCSRRKADELIFSGQIMVNGQVADSPGLRVVPGQDKILFQGRSLELRDAAQSPQKAWKPCLLMLNKPVEVVSTVRDPQGRRTVLDLVPSPWRERRLYPVGRLDYFSEGLLLITDDGDLAHRLTHPRWHLAREYEVRVRPEGIRRHPAALDEALTLMRQGMTLDEGERLAPAEVQILQDKGPGLLLRLVLHQGLNRQIRRMCRDLDLTVLRLRRVSQGPIQLGELKPGQIRELSGKEANALRRAVGL